jgi:hypothetical protein
MNEVRLEVGVDEEAEVGMVRSTFSRKRNRYR